VCVSVRKSEREGERARERARERELGGTREEVRERERARESKRESESERERELGGTWEEVRDDAREEDDVVRQELGEVRILQGESHFSAMRIDFGRRSFTWTKGARPRGLVGSLASQIERVHHLGRGQR